MSEDHSNGDPPARDPLSAFLAVYERERPTRARRGARRFASGEHVWLGSHGAALAREELERRHRITLREEVFGAIKRRNGVEEFDYGELVALSGDFYGSPEDLFDETPARLPWLWEDNDISDIRAMFGEELAWIEDRHRAHGSRYPDSNVRMAWNAKSYIELALRNVDHFGWHNVMAYLRHHTKALELALAARGRDNETFRRALVTNAFADHFLTDAFAAGHIRTPRAQIIAWAERVGLNEKIAGALSKLLHDQDGHVDLASLHGAGEGDRADDDGLHVQDSLGQDWHTRCDGQLFLDAGAAGSTAVQRAVAAVCASLVELMRAWAADVTPRGVYEATRYVPFPHASEPPLVEKFSATVSDEALGRLWKGIGWYAKVPWLAGLERSHVRDLFVALPEIMGQFRDDVATAATDPDVLARIAPEYIAAFREIR